MQVCVIRVNVRIHRPSKVIMMCQQQVIRLHRVLTEIDQQLPRNIEVTYEYFVRLNSSNQYRYKVNKPQQFKDKQQAFAFFI